MLGFHCFRPGLRAISAAIWITALGISADSRLLAQADHIVAMQSDEVVSLAFSPDGTMLAGGGFENTVRLWNPDSGELLRKLVGPKATIRVVAFSPDGEILAAAGDDLSIFLWSAKTGELQRKLQVRKGFLNSLAFSPDGKSLASAQVYPLDRKHERRAFEVILWDVAAGAKRRTIMNDEGGGQGLAFSPDGKTLAAAMASQTSKETYFGIKLWDPETGAETASLAAEDCLPRSVAFSPDGKFLAHGGGTAEIVDGKRRAKPIASIWDVQTGKVLQTFKGTADGYYQSVAFSPDGTSLAVGGPGPVVATVNANGQVTQKTLVSETQLWNVAAGELIWSVHGKLGDVNSVVFSPDGSIIANCDSDAVTIVTSESGKELRVLMNRTLKRHQK